MAKTVAFSLPALAFAWLCSFAVESASADCRNFFVKRHAAVVQHVAVPVFVQPAVFYSAGQDIQAEALAEKVARLVETKLALRQQQTAKVTTPGVFTKCASCHTGINPAGGLTLDGLTPIDCRTYFRWGEIAGAGRNVPERMQALIQTMTPEQKGAINEALLNLVQQSPADRPPPAPVVEGQLE